MFKICRKCNIEKETLDFSLCKNSKDGRNSVCKACLREKQKEWIKNNHDRYKELSRESYQRNILKRKSKSYSRHIKYKYKIDIEEYNRLLDLQNNSCAICGQNENKVNKGNKIQKLSVDHNHRTGKVRGLLCHRCNTLVGYAENELAIKVDQYLKKSI